MAEQVEKATGLKKENHIDKFKYFNPMHSINNTRVWLEHPELADDIAIIERELKDYLYTFEVHTGDKIEGIPVEDKSKF